MSNRLYFDTSVFGGAFDDEFKGPTLKLFNKVISGDILCVYSDLSRTELSFAPQFVREYFSQLPKENMEQIYINDEVIKLANKYIEKKNLSPSSFDDCLHIAVATISRVNTLVSWNFKHIVNVNKISGYNSLNLVMGYSPIEIRSPVEILDHEN